MNLLNIKKIAQAEMGNKRSAPYNELGDKYTHGERVATLAVRLRKLILPEDSGYDEIMTVAAWFHDICNGAGDRSMHAIAGAARTEALLVGHCTAEELEQICGIIRIHDDRKTTQAISNALKIHQDADHLDHFGSFDIWRLVAYTAGHDETIQDALHYLQNRWPDDNTRWRGELHYDISKRIFDDKTEFVKSFIERFAVESMGGIWHEENLRHDT